MGKLTVAKAKKQIIAQIKRKGGLFENVGQKELMQLQDQEDFNGDDWLELDAWIETLDSETVKQYL